MRCAICGTKDYDKLIVHDIGIAAGMMGDDYCFCFDCWDSPNLGQSLFDLLGYTHGMLYKRKSIKIKGRKDKPGGAS